MNPAFVQRGEEGLQSLRPALPGLLFAVATLLFGFGLGIVLGLNEDAIKSRLTASAAAVNESVYHGDSAAAKAVLDKSWTYMQRAHLHAGGLGHHCGRPHPPSGPARHRTLHHAGHQSRPRRGRPGPFRILALGRFHAPGLGSTGAAKESLEWLAMPSSGAVVVATAAVAVLCLAAIAGRRRPG